MNLQDLLDLLQKCPLVASVQASPGSPVNDPETLLKLAQASLMQGVQVLRLEGVENISAIKGKTKVPVIGLIKRKYPDSNLYITPTMREVEELISTGCEVIAIDCRTTPSDARPSGEKLGDLINACHQAGRLVLADCEIPIDALRAQESGCDLVSTTFSTLEPGDETGQKPSLSNLKSFLLAAKVPVIAEGGYQTESQARSAIFLGVMGVVIGGAINDPIKQTYKFVRATALAGRRVGAVDIGGTWIRFGVFDEDLNLISSHREPVQSTHQARLEWICDQAARHEVSEIGVSTGGVYDPWQGRMRETKDTIADNYSTTFARDGLKFRALNDGLATSWGHQIWLDRISSEDVNPEDTQITIAIGTGLGCGIITNHRLLLGCDYPRINDLEFKDGMSFEDVLGGRNLGQEPSPQVQDRAFRAFGRVVQILSFVNKPRHIFLSGGVVFSPWFLERLGNPEVGAKIDLHLNSEIRLSPFGQDAGLFGAAALALFPPIGVFPE